MAQHVSSSLLVRLVRFTICSFTFKLAIVCDLYNLNSPYLVVDFVDAFSLIG